MSAESLVYDALRNNAPVVAMVADRIYQVIVPLGIELPAIAVQRVNTEFSNVIHGFAPTAQKTTFEIHCISDVDGYVEAENLCDAVQAIGQPMMAINRVSLWDPDTEMRAAVLTVDVWEM